MNDIPSLSLLIKFMGMTGSRNDNEALIALRKAEPIIAQLGGWEAVLRGKVTVIGDPFADLQAPPKRETSPPPAPRRPTPQPAPRPTRGQRTQWSPPPQPAPQSKPMPTANPNLRFAKNSNGYWNVKADRSMSLNHGEEYIVASKKGDKKIRIMNFVENNAYGEKLYTFVDVKPDLNDILGI